MNNQLKVAIIVKCKGTNNLKELTEGVIKNFENHETVIIYCCSLFNYRKVKNFVDNMMCYPETYGVKYEVTIFSSAAIVKKIKEKRIYPNYEYVEIVFKKEKRAKGYSC